MSRTITVVGEAGTIDTDTNLTAQGSVTTASLRPDTGYTKIKKIFYGFAGDGLADGGMAVGITFPGAGVLNGPHRLLCGASGGDFTTGADQTAQSVFGVIEDVDIPINGNDITVQLSLYGGTAVTAVAIAVTLYLE